MSVAVAVDRADRRQARSAWRQPLAIVGMVILAGWLAVIVAARWMVDDRLLKPSGQLRKPPSAAHWFGTDAVGRDVFARVLRGAALCVPAAVLIVIAAMAIGSVAGGVAGLLGGKFDTVIMRLADLVFAFPGVILAMAVAAALGPSIANAVIAVIVVSWPAYARLVRGLVLSARSSQYVASSRLLGSSSWRTLWVDIRPNLAGPVLVLGALDVGSAMLFLSGLSFLGLGARQDQADWGRMVADGAREFDKWWIGVFPGLAILTVVVACNFIGDTLRDVLDPRTARARQ